MYTRRVTFIALIFLNPVAIDDEMKLYPYPYCFKRQMCWNTHGDLRYHKINLPRTYIYIQILRDSVQVEFKISCYD